MRYAALPLLLFCSRLESDPYDGKIKFFVISRYYEGQLGKYLIDQHKQLNEKKLMKDPTKHLLKINDKDSLQK